MAKTDVVIVTGLVPKLEMVQEGRAELIVSSTICDDVESSVKNCDVFASYYALETVIVKNLIGRHTASHR